MRITPTSSSFARFTSILRGTRKAMTAYYPSHDSSDDELFVDCVDKHVDVFHFLTLERDDTSVSWEDSDSEENVDCFFDHRPRSTTSCCSDDDQSNNPTVYLDAQDYYDSDCCDDLDRIFVADTAAAAIEVELSERFELSPDSFLEETTNVKCNNNNTNTNNEEEDHHPLAHAVHFAQNIWEGSKQTPVGLVIHVTEGVFGHLVGMIHHGEDQKREGEQQHDSDKVDLSSSSSLCHVASPARPAGTTMAMGAVEELSPLGTEEHLRPETPLVKELRRRLELTTMEDEDDEDPRRMLVHPSASFENEDGQSVSLVASVDSDWLPLVE